MNKPSLGELENRWGAASWQNSCGKCKHFDFRKENRIVSECAALPRYFTHAELTACSLFEAKENNRTA